MSHGKPKDKKQPVRMGSFWGVRCESGKRYSQIVNQKYHISMAALDPTSVKNDEDIVSLVVERDGSKFLLCNLQKDSVLQVNLNLFFDKGEKVVFSLEGRGIVHLTGYLVKDYNDQNDISLQPKNLNDSIMLAKDKVFAVKKESFKKNLSSQNDSWKVESKAEIASPTKTLFASPSKKNNEKLQTNIKGASEGDNWDVESKEDKNSPSPIKSSTSKKSVSISSPQKLTPQKKLFETSKDESEDSSDEDEDDDDEEEETSDDEDAKELLRFAQKRPISSLEDDSDEDDEDFEIDDSSDESDEHDELPVKKKLGKDVLSSKKLKTETSTPLAGKKSITKKETEIIDIDNDSKNGDMNSSIGRTPMPKKKKESLQKSVLNDSKKGKLSKVDVSDSDSEDETATQKQSNQLDKSKSASQLDTSGEAPGSEKKKKKKKKSKAANESNTSVNDSAVKANGGDLSKAQYSKKLTGGVEYEDIRLGNGPIAKKGRLVFVYYTGKLKDNSVFDSKQPGKNKPFSFKLGTGQVIKGWDVAIEGMKVGGKRRIKVPPSMGYQNQRTGPIPPNSTLYFVVELKSVL